MTDAYRASQDGIETTQWLPPMEGSLLITIVKRWREVMKVPLWLNFQWYSIALSSRLWIITVCSLVTLPHAHHPGWGHIGRPAASVLRPTDLETSDREDEGTFSMHGHQHTHSSLKSAHIDLLLWETQQVHIRDVHVAGVMPDICWKTKRIFFGDIIQC